MGRAWTKLTPVALAVLLVSACSYAQNGGTVTEPGSTNGSSTESTVDPATPPLSSIPPPGFGLQSGPPKSPTDLQPDWIAGRVTRGGTGPCYRLVTDDDTQYELYNDDGLALEMGTVVRVRVEPLQVRISCGPGPHLHMLEVETVG